MGLVATNLVPLVGILALRWSILEVVTYVWLEGALLALAACLVAPRTLGWRALLVVPPYAFAMGALLLLQAVLLVLVFFVMRVQHGFWDVVDEGRALLAGLAWGAGLLVVWRLVHLALAWAPSTPRSPAWRVLGVPAAHALALQAVVLVGGLVVRDWGMPILAVALLLALKLGVDLGVYALDERLARTA